MEFNHNFNPAYGDAVRVNNQVRRVVAKNPGPFTGPGTGTYIVGNGEVAVIDPGPMMPDHVANILAATEGECISHIIVTHTHSDHSPASRLLKAETGAPVFAFGPHSEYHVGKLEGGVDRDFTPDFLLLDGETVDGENWQLEAIHTPGHCANHLCFALDDGETLFCGDQLMAWSTTVILPPDGSVHDYLVSLERLASRGESTFLPTHGRPITNPVEYINQTMRHRMERVDQILESIRQGNDNPARIRQHVYQEISPALYAGAELSIMASVEYLETRGDISVTHQYNSTAPVFLLR